VRRVLLSPKWWALHIAVVAVVLVFLRLGEWQWHRAHAASGTLQNFGYAFEWPVFALFVLFFWVKTMREEIKPRRGGDVVEEDPHAAGPVIPRKRPPLVVDEADDAELAAYNAHLARLNARHQRQVG
jgi:DNA-binding transcriptional regulator of glucitol operon